MRRGNLFNRVCLSCSSSNFCKLDPEISFSVRHNAFRILGQGRVTVSSGPRSYKCNSAFDYKEILLYYLRQNLISKLALP